MNAIRERIAGTAAPIPFISEDVQLPKQTPVQQKQARTAPENPHIRVTLSKMALAVTMLALSAFMAIGIAFSRENVCLANLF